jgi:hypothetical protein
MKAPIRQCLFAQSLQFCLADTREISKVIECLFIGEEIFISEVVLSCPVTGSAQGTFRPQEKEMPYTTGFLFTQLMAPSGTHFAIVVNDIGAAHRIVIMVDVNPRKTGIWQVSARF